MGEGEPVANQNFRVKKGLEVGLGATFLYADDTGVGINSSAPRTNLDVRGEANIDSLEVGPGIGSTVFTVDGNSVFDGNVFITGDLEFDDAVLDNLNVTGIATLNRVEFNVGIGSTLTLQFLEVTESAEINGAGIATLGGDPEFNSLSVTGFSTFGGLNTTGFSTFYQNVRVTGDLNVSGDIVLDDLEAGNITVGGTVFTEGLDFGVGIGSTLTVGILSVTEDISVNGAGIATIGGDPEFNTLSVVGFSTFGGLNTTGFSTFYQNVKVDQNLIVSGDITLDDLDSGNISVGGTVTTNGLVFNTGIGTELVVGVASVGIVTANDLTVLGVSTFGGANTTGVSTFYHSLDVVGDLIIEGDIDLSDLVAETITIGGTTTTNELVFNVGIGTSLTMTGISSFNIITGIGSELQFLPSPSISTSTGIGSTTPPSVRPTGEPIQPGDLWFDADSLRQYIYFVDADGTGVWIDSNPPPTQPELKFAGEQGPPGGINLEEDTFNIRGTANQVITRTNIAGAGSTLFVGLSTDVTVSGDLTAGGGITGAQLNIAGVATIGILSVSNGIDIGDDIVVSGDIVVREDLVVDRNTLLSGITTIIDLRFDSGIGTTLEVEDLTVTGNADINGAGIATLGGDPNFSSLVVTGISTLGNINPITGFTTTVGDLYVGGDLFVADDIVFDEATLRNLTISGQANLNSLGFNIGTGGTFRATNEVSIGGTLGVDSDATFYQNVEVKGTLDVDGEATFNNDANFIQNIDVTGDISADEIAARNISASDGISFGVGSGSTLTITNQTNLTQLGFTTASGTDLSLSDQLNVTGVSSFVGEVEFTDAVGYELNVDRLIVPPTGFVDLPGIPVVGGAASFSQLNVTGLATFIGFTTFVGDVRVSGAMTVGSLTATEINFSGGTGIGTDNIVTDRLNVTGLSTFVGLSTFQGNVFIADDLEVKRNLNVGGIATVGILTAGNTVIQNLVVTGDLTGGNGGTIIIDGGTAISGIVTIGDNSITLDGRQGREKIELGTASGNEIVGLNTLTGERSYVRVDEGRFNNFINVSGATSTSTFAGDVTVNGKLEVDGDLELSTGDITVGTINATTGNIGFVSATNAEVSGIITAQDFNSLSDRRVKENVRPIDNPLDKVSRINGVKFDFINSGKKSMGVIAQEVEQVFPELISGSFPKSVNYNGLIGLLIESVKELKSENEELRKRLDKLEE